jgi:hypothetical protein
MKGRWENDIKNNINHIWPRGLYSSGSEQGPVACSCEGMNKPSGTVQQHERGYPRLAAHSFDSFGEKIMKH